MRKSMYYAIVMTGCVGIAGCASQQMKSQGIAVDEISAIRQEGMQPVVGTDIDLREKTKGKVVALKSLQVVAGILGGGVQMSGNSGPRNQAPADGYTVTDGYVIPFTTQQIAAFKGPASAEAAALNQKMQAAHVPVAEQSAYSLNTSAVAWAIDYDKLTGKNDYRLTVSMPIS